MKMKNKVSNKKKEKEFFWKKSVKNAIFQKEVFLKKSVFFFKVKFLKWNFCLKKSEQRKGAERFFFREKKKTRDEDSNSKKWTVSCKKANDWNGTDGTRTRNFRCDRAVLLTIELQSQSRKVVWFGIVIIPNNGKDVKGFFPFLFPFSLLWLKKRYLFSLLWLKKCFPFSLRWFKKKQKKKFSRREGWTKIPQTRNFFKI